MSEAAIHIKNLVKYYGKDNTKIRHLALDNLDFIVPRGSIFGLLGPNGAGKSTLINILAGTVIKTSGEVKIMGVNIDEYPQKAKMFIGVVPQEVAIDTFFSIEQSLEFVAGYFGVRSKDRKTEEILKALSLWDKKDAKPQELSGGMKRRFLVAKAMVHSPEVLILDEPTAGVDIELRMQLWAYVKKLNKQGVTIIITTHYLAEAQELCDEIAFINHGKIIKQDSKQNLLAELGNRHIDVEFKTPVTLKDLKLPQGMVASSLSANIIRVELHAEGNNYSELLKTLGGMKQEVKDLRQQQPDLEKIFHQIIYQ
jgi:ABC-2 type transport system ATP-binding protein